MNIEVTINGKKHKLTPQEARELYNELHVVFGGKIEIVHVPQPSPIITYAPVHVYPAPYTPAPPFWTPEITCKPSFDAPGVTCTHKPLATIMCDAPGKHLPAPANSERSEFGSMDTSVRLLG